MLFHDNAPFEPWARHLIVINSLLCTINSSCNFAFYCGDVVFRQCLFAMNRSGLSKFNLKKCCGKTSTTQSQMDEVVEMEEVTMRPSPPIICSAQQNQQVQCDIYKVNTNSGV